MTSQMKRALARADGVSSPVAPMHIFGPDSTPPSNTNASAIRRAREARRRAERRARAQAGVCRGYLPRALEALLVNEPSDLLVHQDLAAAGLL
jgi:cob(I)alamin adenosyltransferase